MVVIGVLLAGVALLLIGSWWTDGLLGGSEALALFVIYGGLIIGLFAAQDSGLRLAVMAPLAMSGAWGAYAVRKGSLRQYHLDQIKAYKRAIDFDPRNLAARRQLAETYYEVGDLEMAVAEMRVLVELSPTKTEERYLLRHWEEEKRLMETGSAICPRCGLENQPGVNWCRRCEHGLIHYRKKSWLAEAGLKAYMFVLASLSLTVLSYVFLPAVYALIPICSSLLVLLGWKLTSR